MRRRVAKIDQHAIAQVLGDKSIEPRHHIGGRFVERGDQITHVLGVKTSRKRHRVDHVASHDRELSPLGAARCGVVGKRGLGNLGSGQSAWRLCGAKLGDERPGCRIGLRVQLALQQCDEVVVVLERFGLSSRSDQRLYDQPMGVLAQVVERDGATAGLQGMFGTTGGELLRAQPHQGAEGEFKQPLAFSRQPVAPALFADGNVVDQPAPVEAGCLTQSITAALMDQRLEPADIALNGRRIEPYDLAVALQSVLTEQFAQPREGLAQVLLCLHVKVGAPQQGRQLLT